LVEYGPKQTDRWEEQYARFLKMKERTSTVL
jgi:hypothetical protein